MYSSYIIIVNLCMQLLAGVLYRSLNGQVTGSWILSFVHERPRVWCRPVCFVCQLSICTFPFQSSFPIIRTKLDVGGRSALLLPQQNKIVFVFIFFFDMLSLHKIHYVHNYKRCIMYKKKGHYSNKSVYMSTWGSCGGYIGTVKVKSEIIGTFTLDSGLKHNQFK